MCMPNLMPEDPTTATRQSQPADAIPKPDSLKGVQQLEDYHKARSMARQKLGIISGLLGGGQSAGGPLGPIGGGPSEGSGGGGGRTSVSRGG